MKAMVQALAVGVSESVFGQLWRQAGALLDAVIPIVLLVVILVAGISVFFGFVQ